MNNENNDRCHYILLIPLALKYLVLVQAGRPMLFVPLSRRILYRIHLGSAPLALLI